MKHVALPSLHIPFNKPSLVGRELEYITDALSRAQLSGDGHYTDLCNAILTRQTGAHAALITHSCTAALEMAAILCDLAPGDEVIMPSFTFVSTANAVVLRGAVPVFADIDPVTLNIDPAQVAAAVTPRTRAVIAVHYAGFIKGRDFKPALFCQAHCGVLNQWFIAPVIGYRKFCDIGFALPVDNCFGSGAA